MNWGHKITLAFIAFAAFIFYIVIGSFRQNVDLVTDDYYAQEIAYETKMRQKANFKALTSKPSILVSPKAITINFNGNHVEAGNIHFYHPSREIFDQNLEIDLNTEGKQTVSREQLVAGLYRVNLTWTGEGKEYFHQETIFVR